MCQTPVKLVKPGEVSNQSVNLNHMSKMDIDNNSIIENFNNISKYDVQFSKNCAKLSDDVQMKKLTITEVVEQLGPFLIDVLPNKREYGTLILTKVLENLPDNFLTSKQLTFIGNFYADRLNDHHQIIPVVLKGILTLSKNKHLPQGLTAHCLSSIFQNVPCQQQQQADRYVIYEIFKTLLNKHQEEVTTMGFDFVYGLITAIDSERDPRNLLLLFNWLPKVLKIVDLGHLTEEMFEVLACYFPVDFKAPSQESDYITRETLANALCPCLCALPQFGKFCIPIALEKLGSSLRIAKLDSLQLLREGCKVFDESVYTQYSREIWPLLQKEILSSSDEEIVTTSLDTLSQLINKLSQNDDHIFIEMLSDIVDTVKENLRPDAKLFEQSSKILIHVSKACAKSALYVTKCIVPLLHNIYNITTTLSHRIFLFKTLINFVKTYIDIFGNENIYELKELMLIPNLCLKVSIDQESEIRTAGFESLSLLANSLSLELRNCCYENLCNLLVVPQEEHVHNALLECLKSLAANYSNEVTENILKRLESNFNLSYLNLYLNALGMIASQIEFTNYVLETFMNYCIQDDLFLAEIAFDSLCKLLCCYKNHRGIYSCLIRMEIIEKIISWSLNHLNNIESNFKLLKNISQIFKLIIGFQEICEQNVEKITEIYELDQNCVLLFLLNGLLLRLKKSDSVDFKLLNKVLKMGLTNSNSEVQEISFQLVANIVNKKSDDEQLDLFLNNIMNSYNIKKDNVVKLIPWITKALIMKGHSQGDTWINILVESLEDNNDAPQGFQIIMNDDIESLSCESFCNKKLLYRQKFFISASTLLTEKHNANNTNYLVAFGYLIQETPQQILMLQFKKILKLLVLSLETCNNSATLLAILEKLRLMLKNKEPIMEEYVQEFLPRFLKLSTFKSSMKVRTEALQCTYHYATGYSLYKLLPFKQEVLYDLLPCLDDAKRLVRKEAVRARALWFLLDAPM